MGVPVSPEETEGLLAWHPQQGAHGPCTRGSEFLFMKIKNDFSENP